MGQLGELIAQLTAGGVSGAIAIYTTHPLDTVRVQQQMPGEVGRKFAQMGTGRSLMHLFRTEGIFAMFRGVVAPTVSMFAQNAVIFTVSRQCDAFQHRWLKEHSGYDPKAPLPLANIFLSGLVAGAVVAPIVSPTELFKLRLQLQRGTPEEVRARAAAGDMRSYTSNSDVGRKIWKLEGAKGVSRGLIATLWRDVPSFGAYFWTYEWIRREGCKALFDGDITRVDDLPAGITLFAGGVGGVASWVISYPFDVIKTVVQSGDANKIIPASRQVIADGGVRALFKGFNATMIRAFPCNAITFYVFEEMMIGYHKWFA